MTIENDEPTSLQPPQIESVGRRLRAARKRANLSQEQAASSIGTTDRSIGRWESGEAAPAFEDVAKLAMLYDVSLDWLAGRTNVVDLLRPGKVVVNEEAQEVLQRLVEANATLGDVPESLIRHPGIDYAFCIPERCLVMNVDAVKAIDRQLQRQVQKLRGNGR